MHTCPHCNEPISLLPMWRRARTDRFGLLVEPTGIQCPHCLVKLEVTRRRSAFVIAGAWAACLALVALASTLARGNVWVAVAAFLPLLFLGWWGYLIAAHTAVLSGLPEERAVAFPLDVQWACPRCGYKNQSARDLCWNCDKERVV